MNLETWTWVRVSCSPGQPARPSAVCGLPVTAEHVNDDLDFIDEAGEPGSQNDQFNQPVGVAIDTCGNLWVADRINNRIQRLDKNLDFDGRFSDGFDRPTGVALHPNGKSLYVADSLNNRVVRYPLG